jgi:MYXO-CTERM domain-containing protein
MYSPDVDAPIYDWTGARLWGADWRVELYGGAIPDSLTPVVAFGASYERFIMPLISPGDFQNRGGLGDPAVLAVPWGGWAWLQVKVWDVQFGATYEQAAAIGQGGYGQSLLFYAQGGDPASLQLPKQLLGLKSFSVLQPVSEPAGWALLALGLGGLVWHRRR